jgi:hypothetical protein
MDKVSWSPRIFIKTPLLEVAQVGLTQIPGDHDFFSILFSMTNFGTNCKANFIIDFKIDSRIEKHHQVILSN